ncbi:hypothetical protein VIOR3934_01460 [Vibrio orientalis CIP 102891 = ATCC 33934]|uniref:Uncharacterized protein n=1 Tax=Vibrio orientalis CIP 102891 = ATCC 33934 TaxID=675816 RepID=C9QK47_VIBOR|nr:hypothetical protein [Vibrio orientalis]EEX92042.1 hypothetical protein VIA_002686 [Vibrio orientalis CIP 102891 = ATCC 33934]EGU48805.1 hypothetical protein VIOR3934_01460 [Vibrio orientalis CIP 102891 = ATCC 33934]
MTNLELEFEHIYLEVKAERWHQIERFLFSYYCYKHDYVSKQGKPDWELARQSVARSTRCKSLKESALEPVVPLSVVIGEIKRYWRDGELTPSNLRRLLDGLIDYVLISKAELQALKKAGLQNAMPAYWYQQRTDSIYLRFQSVGIELIMEQE